MFQPYLAESRHLPANHNPMCQRGNSDTFERRRIVQLTCMKIIVAMFTLMIAAAGTANAQQSKKRVPVRGPENQFQKRVVSWNELKKQSVVMQQRDYSCGAAAMATVLRYHWGEDITEADVLFTVERMLTVEQLQDRTEQGLLLGDLEDAAKKMGYVAASGTMTIDKLLESKVPVILAIRHGETNHFVVYRGWTDRFVFLADPIRGNVRMTISGFNDLWIDNAILVVAIKGKTKSNVSRLFVRNEEVTRGWLLKQQIRQQMTR